jgi:hypothetical protein
MNIINCFDGKWKAIDKGTSKKMEMETLNLHDIEGTIRNLHRTLKMEKIKITICQQLF